MTELEKKYSHEMNFWKRRFATEKQKFNNSHYRDLMLSMAETSDGNFLNNKVVADFGCGPRGSLAWVPSSCVKIGIDVLVDLYVEHFADNMKSHGMIYVKSSESDIPLPTAYCDVVFTINSLDHVANMCMFNEIDRILKPGGVLYGSFNLHEPATDAEPQVLGIPEIHSLLNENFIILREHIAEKDPQSTYKNLFEHQYQAEDPTKIQILWLSAKKKQVQKSWNISDSETVPEDVSVSKLIKSDTPYLDKFRWKIL